MDIERARAREKAKSKLNRVTRTRPGTHPHVIAEVAAQDWNGLLEELGFVDVYLTRGYIEASTLLEAGRPLFLRTEHAVFAAILREGPTDVIAPYGYGGPIGPGFWEPYDEWCRATASSPRSSASTPLREPPRPRPQVRVEPLGPTVGWRLDADDDLFERMHRHRRRVVRKAVGPASRRTATSPPRVCERFARRLYEQTMERQGAEGFYYFPARLTGERWRPSCATTSCPLRGEARRGRLCLYAPPLLHYHLGASSEAGRKLGASNLLFLEAALVGRRSSATRASTSAGESAAGAIRFSTSSSASTRAASWRWPSARRSTTRKAIAGSPAPTRGSTASSRPIALRCGRDSAKAIFLASLGGLAWTRVGYPVAAAALRRVREREVAKDEITPSVTLMVPPTTRRT